MKFALIGDADSRFRFLYTLLHSDDETVKCEKKKDGKVDLINSPGILHIYQATTDVGNVDICSVDFEDLGQAIEQDFFKEYSAIIFMAKRSGADSALDRIDKIIDSVEFYTNEKPTEYIKELIVTCTENEKKEQAEQAEQAKARIKATIVEAEQIDALGRSIETRLSDYPPRFFDEVSETASSEETAEEPIATIFPA